MNGNALRALIARKEILIAPGAPDALCAILAERLGFEAVYLSGGATSTGVAGLPDIGLLTVDEMVMQLRYLARATDLPVIADADTGYGEALNVMRTVSAYTAAGAAAIQIEDQVSPKRCGHLDGKECIPAEEMVIKVRAAVSARAGSDVLVIARTDARQPLGFEEAVHRAYSYFEAGADAVFPEALESRDEFARFADAVRGPLVANMTEFGKSPLLTATELQEMGYRIVIFPVSAMRVAVAAVRAFYRDLRRSGTQVDWMERMLTRAELYDLIDYSSYERREATLAADSAPTARGGES
jgi:methylisocitrate lyase